MGKNKESVSLLSIIKCVLNDRGIADTESYDADIKALQRKFNKLIEKLGCNNDVLKPNGKNFEFQKSEILLLKVLLTQLYYEDTALSDFVNNSKYFSVKDINKLIQSLLDEADRAGVDEPEREQLALFLAKIFFISPLRSVEKCHLLINVLASHLQELPSSRQTVYLHKIERLLDKEFSLRVAESAIEIWSIANSIELSKEFDNNDIGCQDYDGFDPEIRYEYIQRDRAVLERIREDDALRQYIETTFKKKAEDIFNYAALEINPK